MRGRRILVVRDDKIGDLVLALPLLAALKRAGAFVGVLTSPYAKPLLAVDPRVDALLENDGSSDPLPRLRALRFDTSLHLWARWPTAWLAWRAGIATRLGPSFRPFSLLFNQRLSLRRGQGLEHESEYNLRYAEALGIARRTDEPRLALAPKDEQLAKAWLAAHAAKLGPKRGPLIVLHPGSRGSAQNWAPTRYARLAEALRKRHKARLLISGGPGDEDAVASCGLGLSGPAALMSKPLPLRAFAALLGQAKLFVSASTGPMHLAAAVGTPTLSLFPPLRAMSPLRWGPRGNRHAVLLPQGLGFRAPAKPGRDYVSAISVEQALQAAGPLLAK